MVIIGAIQYGYDMDGRRLWKETNGQRTWFLYDGERLLAEFTYDATAGALHLQASDTWGPSGLIARTVGGSTTYYLYTEHGDVAHRLDATGTVLSTDCYDA